MGMGPHAPHVLVGVPDLFMIPPHSLDGSQGFQTVFDPNARIHACHRFAHEFRNGAALLLATYRNLLDVLPATTRAGWIDCSGVTPPPTRPRQGRLQD